MKKDFKTLLEALSKEILMPVTPPKIKPRPSEPKKAPNNSTPKQR